MWTTIHNILSVARYESKLLTRSWFFKLFSFLAIAVILFYDMAQLTDTGGSPWVYRAVPSTIPYMNILMLNVAQAIIAVFLSSEFIKRDKQLDTSEVFYVRPLSNAEYVFGKTWGNLRVFLLLNLIVLAVGFIFNLTAVNTYIDFSSYIVYFLLISIPTLIFIMGLSFFMMLLLKNQALTFIVLLGYIMYSLFYLQDKYYYLFDYMAYSLPMFKSTITGFTGMETIIALRVMYLLAGVAFVFLTVFLFARLPANPRMRYIWLAGALVLLAAAGQIGMRHIQGVQSGKHERAELILLNDTYGHYPILSVLSYDMEVEQLPEAIDVKADMTAVPRRDSTTFVFCLNPGLTVSEVTSDGMPVAFERKRQLLLVDFGRTLRTSDTVQLTIRYNGGIDENLCYLDMPDAVRDARQQINMVKIPKKYAFLGPDFCMLTPETYWYPRAGTSFTMFHSDWQQAFFSDFDVKVKPVEGQMAIVQGAYSEAGDGWYRFCPETPLPQISLVIGDYEYLAVDTAGLSYELYYIKGHDFFRHMLDSIKGDIPTLIEESMEDFERENALPYQYNRFSLVEVPGTFTAYSRAWTQAWEWTQPSMVFFPEKGFSMNSVDFTSDIKRRKRWRRVEATEAELETFAFTNFLYTFQRRQGWTGIRTSAGVAVGRSGNPWYQFPQLFDFIYNVYSPDIPMANRLVSVYMQRDEMGNANNFRRNVIGISSEEQASLLLQEQSLEELVADTSKNDLISSIIQLKAEQLFAYGEMELGRDSFENIFSDIVTAHPFRNLRFEEFLDRLADSTGVDLKDRIDGWYRDKGAPRYLFAQTEFYRVREDLEVKYEVSQIITNDSDKEGMIILMLQFGWEDIDYIPVMMGPHETKEAVFVSEERPRAIIVRTLLSENLPGRIETSLNNWGRILRRDLRKPGIFTIEHAVNFVPENEIIVDNEDKELFSTSEPRIYGLLPRWLAKEETSIYKYHGFSAWRPPLKWTPTTNNFYYGQYVRSANVIRSGRNGGISGQTATWKVPIKEAGRYDVYYNMWRDNNAIGMDWNASYDFRITQGDTIDVKASLEFRRCYTGWNYLTTVVLPADTAQVVLSNDTRLRFLIADAVRFVRRDAGSTSIRIINQGWGNDQRGGFGGPRGGGGFGGGFGGMMGGPRR
ncbi:MAG: xanthan lyase [Bacteroidales bacterium]|nr:xanthan lyase [Bacteroidales bacterium]